MRRPSRKWARKLARRYRAFYAARQQPRRQAPRAPIATAFQTLETTRRAEGSVCGQRPIANFAAAGGRTLEAIE
jgi:hypothetical protein